MVSSPFRVGLLAVLAGLTLTCVESTQVTFNITTDVPCADVAGTSITVGLDGTTEGAAPLTVSNDCRSDGTVGAIGTYTVVPRGTKPVTASVKIAMAVGKNMSVEADCTAEKGYQGCIVARRRVSFVPHRRLMPLLSAA